MLDAQTSALVLVDFQTRLMPAIDGGAAAVERALLLARAARLLGIPVLATEENPESLGPTLEAFAGLPDRVIAKRRFDAAAEPALPSLLGDREAALLCGCEAHVCLLQTVLGLQRRGLAVAVAADAVGSRRAPDKAAALGRMERAGVAVYTAEMAIFEWLKDCDHPRFKEILALVR